MYHVQGFHPQLKPLDRGTSISKCFILIQLFNLISETQFNGPCFPPDYRDAVYSGTSKVIEGRPQTVYQVVLLKVSEYCMSRLMRKPANWVSEQDPELYNYRRWLETGNFRFRKKRNCTSCVAKTKTLISCAITAQLICTFVIAYACCSFFQETAFIKCLYAIYR